MIRIRWAVFAIALGCLLAMGHPVAAIAFSSPGAVSAPAQGLRAASARAAHADRTAPSNRPVRRHPTSPAHRSAPHPRMARHRSRTYDPHAAALNDRDYAAISSVERMNPDRFHTPIGETERALGSRGPPRASPPVKSARVEPPPSSTAPSALSISPAHFIRAPPYRSSAPSRLSQLFGFTHAVRHEGAAAATHLPSGETRS